LIHEAYSARQGVEDDDMNLICLGGRVLDESAAWELVRVFLDARFSGAERHRRRLGKIAAVEGLRHTGGVAGLKNAPDEAAD
jgi:ribose 5-phosphate isomerase B